MQYPTIRIEGSILSADILDKLEELKGQKPADFNLECPVKDEISRAWADAQDYWRIFQRKIESLKDNQSGVTETRNQWMQPLLGLLGYKLEVQQSGEVVMGKNFAISHRDPSRDNFPAHIVGFKDSLDKKAKPPAPRMSPHGLVQEFLNLKEEYLYSITSNGLQLRLLRDSSRLVKLSYLEFDLERMFVEGHYHDFALMFRIMHASRMPINHQSISESLIELYHQDSLDSGSRIRSGLSIAVEESILSFANGFLNHPDNDRLRELVERAQEAGNHKFENEFYHYQLRLIYRLLFLMVIEERNLIFPDKEAWNEYWSKQPKHIQKLSLKNAKEFYYKYYSVNRLRSLAGKRYLADAKNKDYWIALKNTFRLFESEQYGTPLGIRPLAGDLFGQQAIGILNECSLDNSVIIDCLTRLTIFEHPDTGQKIRVNYGALNVEEFGSVYEGLLEYDPHIYTNGKVVFSFKAGDKRSSSGSHYTPDELVTPLIKHSLDYLIEDRVKLINEEIKAGNLAGANQKAARAKLVEKHILTLTVCDVACGSGHILLNAARRIAAEVAMITEEEDQPTPQAFRKAIREVIRHCIYGVDLNPLAVELCKVALWLEAHNPNEPLNFLDHHIKCGNAIVGLAHQEELQNGIANEAFKALPRDDKDFLTEFRNRNKTEIKYRNQGKLNLSGKLSRNLDKALDELNRVNDLPENTPEQIDDKKAEYQKIQHLIHELKLIADIQVAQFFIPKLPENKESLVTDEKYFEYLNGTRQLVGPGIAKIIALANKKKFFHWFLEFPKVMTKGGFDCILGNPPYLGGQKISINFGNEFLNYLKSINYTTGSCDLIAYFLQRITKVIGHKSFFSLITTNSISQGVNRESGLGHISVKGNFTFAIKSTKWPGEAAVEVSLVSFYKGEWNKKSYIGNVKVNKISSFLESTDNLLVDLLVPQKLKSNANICFQGSNILGKGFMMPEEKAIELINQNSVYSEVLFPYVNGDDLNSSTNQSPSRWVINFRNWEASFCQEKYPLAYKIVEEKVKPERKKNKRKNRREKWWVYAETAPNLYNSINDLSNVFALCLTGKFLLMSSVKSNRVFSHATGVVSHHNFTEYSFLQSTFHEEWAWKYCSSMGISLRYTPSSAFETYPTEVSLTESDHLKNIGEFYEIYRKELQVMLVLGQTKVFNQFHNKELISQVEPLKSKDFQKKYGKESWNLYNHLEVKKEGKISYEEAVPKIEELRRLHKEMDEAVLAAYGWDKESPALVPLGGDRIGVREMGIWPAIDLRHDFYEVEYLPENDRIRYTIHPDARKEILKRLLLLNHKIYAEEVAQGLHDKKKTTAKKKVPKKKTSEVKDMDLLPGFDSPLEVVEKSDEFALPTTKRFVIEEPAEYAEFIMKHLLMEAGELSLEKLLTAYSLLCHPERLAEKCKHRDSSKWLESYEYLDIKGFFLPALEELKNARYLILKNHFLSINSLPEPPEDDWLRFDARLALATSEYIIKTREKVTTIVSIQDCLKIFGAA